MELLAVIGGGALVWFAYTCVRGWRHSGETLERLRREADGKPSSSEDSAEQKMSHTNDQIRSWSSDRPS
jgi:hypothetical protein